jgi:hypothetical protein
LQINLRHAFRHNLELGGNYTWAKSIDTTADNSAGAGNAGAPGDGNFTIRNLKLDRAVSQFDVPHRVVIYSVLELPFGKGQRFLSATPMLSQALGGWRLSTNTQLQSGLPQGIGSGSGFGRPDLVGDPVLPAKFRCYGPQTCPLPDGSTVFVPAGRLLYFNPTAFRNRVIQYGPGAGANAGKFADDIYWYGTSPRLLSNLRGWGTNITDLSVSRSLKIVERASLVFRADVVNVFNHKNFSDGGLDKGFGGTFLPSNPSDPAQLARLGQSISSTFGTLDVRSTGLSPRYFQFAVRVVF